MADAEQALGCLSALPHGLQSSDPCPRKTPAQVTWRPRSSMTLSRRSVVSLKPCFCSGSSELSWIWPRTMSSSRAMSSYCAATLRGWSEEFRVKSPE